MNKVRMIKRHITKQLQSLARQFPVVTILGPRQSGKTTLARSEFPRHTYMNLENLKTRTLAERDYQAFFEQYPGPLILDEIQRVPPLLSAIQTLVDESREPGKYILTGSHQPQLKQGISQSLAGRTGILHLLPLSIVELADAGITLTRDEFLTRGFLPGQYADGVVPADLLGSYYATYVERDVRQLVNVGNQTAFEAFIKLLAGRIGQLVNFESLANDAGISATTAAAWLSVLEASFIVFRLPRYFNNFGKRVVKTPKVYFTDVGLAAWLLGIEEPAQAARDPLFGGLFENMVVAEALKARRNAGKPPELYFYRDHKGLEIDLVLNLARRLRCLEIKAGMTWDASWSAGLAKFSEISKAVESSAVIYSGETMSKVSGVKYANFKDTAKIINAPNL